MRDQDERREAAGERLSAAYAEVVAEPVPVRLTDTLAQLGREPGGAGQ